MANKVRERDKEVDLYAYFGKKLRETRKSKGLSASELSQKSGVSISMISLLETGKQLPSMENFFKLCRAMGVSPLMFYPQEWLNERELSEVEEMFNELSSERAWLVLALMRVLLKSQ